MSMGKANRKQGFTLLEMMVAMALGLIVMTAMASLFKDLQSTTRPEPVVFSRIEMARR